jgi:type II secretory pathway pseudopilin PulG
MLTKIFKIKKSTQGYTLVETMIAISIFIIVIMAGMGALLNANLVHQKSQDMRSVLDSLSFIMEEMSKSLRVGTNYQCFITSQTLLPVTLGAPRSCADGWAIAFEATGGNTSSYGDQWAYYFSGDGKIYKSTDGANTYTQLTPPEVVIDQASGFSVLGAETAASGNNQQPLVIIRLVGTITYKGVISPFSLETTVSQRSIDI